MVLTLEIDKFISCEENVIPHFISKKLGKNEAFCNLDVQRIIAHTCLEALVLNFFFLLEFVL